MKKSLLILSAGFFSNALLFAQSTPVSTSPTNKNVVLEELTGIHCGYCPDGHAVANSIATAHPDRVVLINIHAGGYAAPNAGEPDLRTTDGTAVDNWMAADGYPAGSVQRRAQAGALTTGRGSWNGIATPIFSEASPVNMAMDATIDVATRQLTLHVEMYYTATQTAGTTHYLNIGILQNNFEGPQSNYGSYNPTAILPNGKYLHQHIFRGFINAGGTWGEAIDATQTGVITKTVTYTLPASINATTLDIANLKFFSFLGAGHNSATTSEIITGAEIAPTYTNIPPAIASANSITNTIQIACDNPATITPTVKVTNGGAAITSLTFSTVVNGGTPSIYNWTGTIPEMGSLEIPVTGVAAFTPTASNTAVVSITSVNGGAGSVATVSASKTFATAKKASSTAITIQFKTDQYGSETTWELKNSNGDVVASGGPYSDLTASGTTVQTPVVYTTLEDGSCFSLTVYDAYSDGMNAGYGSGSFTVKDASNTTLITGGTFTDETTSYFKATGSGAGIEDIMNSIEMLVYPNPASEVVNVSFEAQGLNYVVSLVDLSGRTVISNELSNLAGSQSIELPVHEVAPGSYMVTISNGTKTVNQKVVIQ